ncbi:hypothetical protein HK405_005219 [Cladochytrium tenue]|nr:hypothetical protein HK405_005219 [Cladochytrium tenue]
MTAVAKSLAIVVGLAALGTSSAALGLYGRVADDCLDASWTRPFLIGAVIASILLVQPCFVGTGQSYSNSSTSTTSHGTTVTSGGISHTTVYSSTHGYETTQTYGFDISALIAVVYGIVWFTLGHVRGASRIGGCAVAEDFYAPLVLSVWALLLVGTFLKLLQFVLDLIVGNTTTEYF